ncbi:MAG: fasciclin domain-containing protein [Gemmatimonadaceae bacterium]
MKRKPADKVVPNAVPTTAPKATTPTPDLAGNGSSPYRTPPRPRVAPGRVPRWRPKENILQIAAATGRFETLGRAIAAAGLTETLSETGPFTLFAPTDRAFAKMSSPDLTALLEDKTRLRQLVGFHVVPSKVRAPRKQRPSSLTTLDGKPLEIAVIEDEDGGYRVGKARIVKTNIRASNGVIHAIDTILTPR